MPGREDIQIRDPFILPVAKEQKYYLFGTTDKDCWDGPATGFDAYVSRDLISWEGPIQAFRPAEDFWADKNFWAPEVYCYNGSYYMFASFKADGACRGTQVLISGRPEGPFVPHSHGPVTPKEWECLDGTLYIDEDNNPWIIFCHEWLQVNDGEMHAMRLNNTLDAAVGEPVMLFRASEAPWVVGHVKGEGAEAKKIYVTDGPYIYKAKNGELIMLWSSSGKEGYAIGIARSATGSITGPWLQDEEPLFGKDGGHGMLFKTFEGDLMLTIHRPNKTPLERPIFIKVQEEDGRFSISI